MQEKSSQEDRLGNDPREANPSADQRGASSFRSSILALLPFFAVFCGLVGLTWFVCDDAYISFRYVRNLVEGNGLVFNQGEAVEGYTNFLWVLELGLLWKLLWLNPHVGSLVLSIGLTFVLFGMVYRETAQDLPPKRRATLGVLALGLLMTSTTFAAWTTSGLETRQFTALTVAALLLASRAHRNAKYAVWSSGLAGLAELTRPEGMLVGCVCCGFILADAFWRNEFRWKLAVHTALPFGSIVVAHFLFRYWYYDEWLPNTYYAKHVREWYEAGFDYFTCVTVETGLYLLLPFAIVGAIGRLRKKNDLGGFLYLAMIALHIAYLMRVGGDHFEYRPLDFYWPLLVPLTVEGLWSTANESAALLRQRSGRKLAPMHLLIPAYFLMVVYCSVIQFQIYWITHKLHRRGPRPVIMQVDLTEENSKWLRRLPMMKFFCDITNPPRRRGIAHFVGMRIMEHKRLGEVLRYDWSKLEEAERPFLPQDGVAAMGMVGVMPFHLPDISIIDVKGLTDAVIARNKVEVPNDQRVMAHDRNPPPGYLHKRGINIFPHAPVESAKRALEFTTFATRVAKDMWMPFDAADHNWVAQRFPAEKLAARYLLSAKSDAPITFEQMGQTFELRKVLESFEGKLGSEWETSGAVVTGPEATRTPTQGAVFGRVGNGIASTFVGEHGDIATGTLSSPKFDYSPGDWLFFLVSGGSDPALAVEVVVDGRVLGSYRGTSGERLELVGVPLPKEGSGQVQVKLLDRSAGAWGHLNLDHLFLARVHDDNAGVSPKR